MPASALCMRLLPSNMNGLRDDADRQRAELASDLRDDRSCAGAGAATLAGRDEHHVRALERFLELVAALHRRFLADARLGAGAEAARELGADVDLHLRVAHQQRLRVGVDRDELDAAQTCVDHAVDGVRAAAADADDLDHCEVVLRAVLDRHAAVTRSCLWMVRCNLQRGAETPCVDAPESLLCPDSRRGLIDAGKIATALLGRRRNHRRRRAITGRIGTARQVAGHGGCQAIRGAARHGDVDVEQLLLTSGGVAQHLLEHEHLLPHLCGTARTAPRRPRRVAR